MNSLVGYASSDEENDDALPERPAKVAKTETNETLTKPSQATTLPEMVIEQPTQPSPKQRPARTTTPPGPTTVPPIDGPAPSALPDAPPFSPYTYERQRLRELTMPTVPNFDIPDSPSPPVQNSEEAAVLAHTTKKFERFLELKKQGVHFNDRLQNSSSLQNPSLLSKLMDFAGISRGQSYASSLPDELSVPTNWPEAVSIENLMKQQERREKRRLAERDKVEFVSSSSAGKSEGATINSLPATQVAKRSKFDKR